MAPTDTVRLFDPAISFIVFFIGVIFFRFLQLYVLAFFSTAIILSVDERMEGKDPRFFPILRKTFAKRHQIRKAVTALIIPVRMQFFSLWSVKQFVLHEMVLHDRSAKEAIARSNVYQEQNWVRELVVSLKWTGVIIPLYFLGIFLIPLSGFVLFSLGLIDSNKPLDNILILLLPFFVMILYFGLLTVIVETLNLIYWTILYKAFVERTPVTDVKDSGMKFVIRNVTTGTEKQIPL